MKTLYLLMLVLLSSCAAKEPNDDCCKMTEITRSYVIQVNYQNGLTDTISGQIKAWYKPDSKYESDTTMYFIMDQERLSSRAFGATYLNVICRYSNKRIAYNVNSFKVLKYK